MFELLFGIFAISVPIFYLWGLWRFIKRFFLGGDDNQTSHTGASSNRERQFIDALFERVEQNPDLSLSDFLEEMRERKRAQYTTTPSTDGEPSTQSGEAHDDLSPAPPAKPAFTWRAWYADHSIDFILYLGAFMIVAAVSLFVGFQWETFGGITRFGIVVAFTLAWFVASFVVQQTLRMEQVAVVFATIGAILIPFCGVAYQQFVATSSASLGIVWLLTSIISTIIYISLSLFYHQRYFTYFSNLSILASLLSLVEISSADPAYYVLAANITATILLIARIVIKHTSETLEDYLAVDVERSSIVIITFSVIGGALLLSEVAIGILSVEVFVVLLATLIYLGLYLTLRLNAITVTLSHFAALLTLGHGLLTFGIDHTLTLYIVLIANFAIQFAVHHLIYRRNPEIYSTLSRASLLIATGLYIWIILLTQGGVLAIPAALALMGNGIYFATQTDHDWLWYPIAILCHAVTTHLLVGVSTESNFALALLVYIMVGAGQLVFTFAPVHRVTAQAFVTVGVIVVAFCGLTSLAEYIPDLAVLYKSALSDRNEILLLINAFFAISLLGITLFLDNRREDRLHHKLIVNGIGITSAIYYLFSLPTGYTLLSMAYAIAVLLIVWLVYERTRNHYLFYVIFVVPYVVITHSLIFFDANYEFAAIALTMYSVGIYLVKGLPHGAYQAKHLVPIVAQWILAFMGLWGGVSSESMSIQFVGWLMSYTMIGMLWFARPVIGDISGRSWVALMGLLQYFWHLIFLAQFFNEPLFSNIQWYSAGTAAVCLMMGIYLRTVYEDEDNQTSSFLEIVGVLILILPNYVQILSFETLLYFLLGIVQSLIVVAVGITSGKDHLRNYGGFALIGAVFLQSSDVLLALPRWLVVGGIGLALVGAGLYLSIRRQGNKNPVVKEE